MLGYETYLDKSINGIKTISDGTTIIQNGNIQTNNITTSQLDTSHISSNTGEFDNFVIDNITANVLNAQDVSSNVINTNTIVAQDISGNTLRAVTMRTHNGNTEISNNHIKIYNTNVSTTNVRLQVGLDYVRIRDDFGVLKSAMNVSGSVNASQFVFMDASGQDVEAFTYTKYLNLAKKNSANTFTSPNTFTSIQADSISVGVSGSIGTTGSPFIATSNNHITTKKYVDDAILGINYSAYPTLSGNNYFTGSLNNFSGNLNITGTTTTNHLSVSNSAVFNSGASIIPPQYRVDGVITTTPNFNGNYFPYGDNNYTNLLCADTTVGGNLTSLYDVAAIRNMSCGATLFTNNISNNTTALTITSLSGLNINANTTLTGDLNVSNLSKTTTMRVSKLQNYNNVYNTSNFLDIESVTRRMDWRHYSIERKLILAIVWYSIRAPRMIPCSMRQLESYDDDDYWLLEPGVKVEIYDATDYVTLLDTFDNTNGIAPNMFYNTGGKAASCKVYYFDEQIQYPYISYVYP